MTDTTLATDQAAPADGSDQARYQVRYDVGAAGAARIGAADVLVWADAFGDSEPPLAEVGAAVVLRADLPSRGAVADRIVAIQAERGRRTSVAIVAAGAGAGVAAQDVLVAGAVIDALEARGIDFTSPEAAVASAAFQGLRGAVAHLSGATPAGRRHAAANGVEATRAAARVDAADRVETVRG